MVFFINDGFISMKKLAGGLGVFIYECMYVCLYVRIFVATYMCTYIYIISSVN